MTCKSEPNENIDLIWGVKNIAQFIGLNERQTFHLLSKGRLPAKNVGGRWVAVRSKLVNFFTEEAAA